MSPSPSRSRLNTTGSGFRLRRVRALSRAVFRRRPLTPRRPPGRQVRRCAYSIARTLWGGAPANRRDRRAGPIPTDPVACGRPGEPRPRWAPLAGVGPDVANPMKRTLAAAGVRLEQLRPPEPSEVLRRLPALANAEASSRASSRPTPTRTDDRQMGTTNRHTRATTFVAHSPVEEEVRLAGAGRLRDRVTPPAAPIARADDEPVGQALGVAGESVQPGRFGRPVRTPAERRGLGLGVGVRRHRRAGPRR